MRGKLRGEENEKNRTNINTKEKGYGKVRRDKARWKYGICWGAQQKEEERERKGEKSCKSKE